MALVDLNDQEQHMAMADLMALSVGQSIPRSAQLDVEQCRAITRGQRRLNSDRERLTPRDTQDYTVTPKEVNYWKQRCPGLEVDACADPQGKNAVMKEFWSDALAQVWDGRKVWCNPPFNTPAMPIARILRHFQESRKRDATSQALFVLPIFDKAAWEEQLNEMPYLKLVHTYPQGFPLFHARDGAQLKTRWKVGIYWSGVLSHGRGPAYGPIPTNAGPQVQVSTKEATRPRAMGFLDQVEKAYAKDVVIGEWIKLCRPQSHQQDRKTGFRLVGNILWRVKEGHYQLVIPNNEQLKEIIMKELHDVPSAGHLARDKTLEKIRRRFWWPGWTRDVEQWVNECPICQVTKGTGKAVGELHQPTPPHEGWQVVNMDFVTGLPKTARGWDAILTFTDRFSKMVHLVPLEFAGSTAQQVARIYFDNVWRLHGVSQKIISDRDPRFMSAFWTEIFRLLGTQLAPSTPYHPQSDGQAKNTNRTMEQMLRAYVDTRQTDWDLHLSAVEFAINDSLHAST
jgi:hypothetical protein